ncbi:hypothetical protein ABTK75_19935, partial [Acinetobacter baumannii]
MFTLRPLALAAASWVATSAFAQATPTALDAAIVTGTRAKDRTRADTAGPVDVLSRDEVLRAAGPDGNLAAALQALLPS